jgi:CheY-like chemotaxis protein
MLCEMLESMGHQARVAYSAISALQIAADLDADLVLLDIGLPDIDGYEVARRLRADPRCHDVYIVGLSGFASNQDRARALGARFDEHCAKPIDLAELGRVIDRATAASAARQRRSGEAEAAQEG